MDANDIEKYYNQLSKLHRENDLESKGVTMPKLKNGNNFTKDTLVLVYLFKNFGQVVSKRELTEFMQKFYPEVNDVQQARHLAAQKGWYINSGTRGDKGGGLKAGDYILVSLSETYPSFKKSRRQSGLTSDSWEAIKEKYGHRCVTCGSKENEEHLIKKGTITKIQQGHMNPNLPLTPTNSIPQCSSCNQPYRNYFYFDANGRVDKINDPTFIKRSPVEIRKKMFEILLIAPELIHYSDTNE